MLYNECFPFSVNSIQANITHDQDKDHEILMMNSNVQYITLSKDVVIISTILSLNHVLQPSINYTPCSTTLATATPPFLVSLMQYNNGVDGF